MNFNFHLNQYWHTISYKSPVTGGRLTIIYHISVFFSLQHIYIRALQSNAVCKCIEHLRHKTWQQDLNKINFSSRRDHTSLTSLEIYSKTSDTVDQIINITHSIKQTITRIIGQCRPPPRQPFTIHLTSMVHRVPSCIFSKIHSYFIVAWPIRPLNSSFFETVKSYMAIFRNIQRTE